MSSKPDDRPHLKTGRKPKVPPPDASEKIKALAADGFSVVGVAAHFHVDTKTLARWLDEDPELRQALDEGRENERQCLHNLLYRQATEHNNATAAMFLLKARHGYREGDQGDAGNRVQITFALPGAMPLKDFVIENGSDPAQRISAKSPGDS